MKNEFLENAVFYEVYPTSFYDSNGDGVGDIKGITAKLDYISSLGANGIWLNPCFESPFKDGGYDISDYYKIDKKFGSLNDIKELFDEAKKRGIKILLDLVMGHTSIEHPWFTESQKHEKNPYSGTYIWKPLGNPAENKDGQFLSGLSERGEMFRINFYAMQPALNYGYYKPDKSWQDAIDAEAPKANRQKLVDVCLYWLGMGAAGFRVDMANYMIKNDRNGQGNIAFWNDIIPRIKERYPESIFVSEWFHPKRAVGKSSFDIDFSGGYFIYYTGIRGEPESFSRNSYLGENGKNFFIGIKKIFADMNAAKARGYAAVTLGNHDRERMSLGRSFDAMKAAFAFHMTMPHVPFVYYGDEVGMSYQHIKSKDGGYGRTGSRTPMQWDNTKNRGFSTVDEDKLYLPVEADTQRCVGVQANDENSLLNTVKKLAALKRNLTALRSSAPIKVISKNFSGNPFIYKRVGEKDEVITILCPKKTPVTFGIKRIGDLKNYEIISNNMTFENEKCTSEGEGFAVLYRYLK
ncbi:MAG: glycosylase [Clostridiales bacterium]|jgi:maltose alpha-D-glucosyltransferase/alpha-amylase|nr:glycosylase [Clostridiales bacterium]